MGATGTDTTVFVARQPIFDRKKAACGYELLFRSGLANHYDASDGDTSTLDVIANSFVNIGLDELTGGQRGFINFTRNLLLQDIADLLPPDRITVEILEDIEPDDEVLRACERLKTAGYVLALDDFVLADRASPFLDLADIVKVDFTASTPDERKQAAALLNERGIAPLAEKVETVEDFDAAMADGYAYFQGYFFSKPVIHQGRSIPGSKLAYLRVLQEVNRPEISFDDLERIVQQDVLLTYKLLRFVNAAWFGLRHKITSIKHALVWLGPREIRKWFALVTLRNLGTDKPNELFLRALVRAKLGEAFGTVDGLEKSASELYLMGMFSVIDALLDVPMEEILPKLPLSEDVNAALLGQPGRFRSVHDTMVSYERGDWGEFSTHAREVPLSEHLMPRMFSESLKWANHTFDSVQA